MTKAKFRKYLKEAYEDALMMKDDYKYKFLYYQLAEIYCKEFGVSEDKMSITERKWKKEWLEDEINIIKH